MKKLRYSFLNPILFVVVLWKIRLWEFTQEVSLVKYGLYPREWFGIKGIFTWVFIHGTHEHLLSNTFPLLILGAAMYYFYDKLANIVILNIYIFTGITTWLFAKQVYHIGASGLVYGLFGFLFFGGIFRKDKIAIALSLLVTLFYGGIIWGIFPTQENVSWEGHLFGLLTGLSLSYYFRKDYLPKEINLNGITDFRHPTVNYVYKPEGKLKQNTNAVVMIRPHNFGFNKETSITNIFQKTHELLYDKKLNKLAIEEFNSLVGKLRFNGVNVLDFEDNIHLELPDSVFPNNWISMQHSGEVFYYPMMAENRRKEYREDIIDLLVHKYQYTKTITHNLTSFTKKNLYLEGTGSMVLDHKYKIAYANKSSRTSPQLFQQWCQQMNYYPILFDGYTKDNSEICHTNIVLSIGDGFVVICLDIIQNQQQKEGLLHIFKQTNKKVIEISEEQLFNFCGNILQLENNLEEKIIVMSSNAFAHFSEKQKTTLSQFGKIIHSNLSTIENFGGGSVRSMLAEVFLPKL